MTELRQRVPNLALRRIRVEERQQSRAEFAKALTQKARELGEQVAPTERYVARLENGDILYPQPAHRRVLVALCGRPITELGFIPHGSMLAVPPRDRLACGVRRPARQGSTPRQRCSL